MKAIIFDFDGVIENSFEFHRSHIEKFMGVPFDAQTLRDMHMGNIYENTPEVLQGIKWEDYFDFVREETMKLKIKNDVRDTLERLSEKSQLFVISSCSEKNVNGYLRNNEVRDLFSEVLGMESAESKVEKFKFIFEKYDLGASDCVFVTDTLGDVIEGHEVGLRVVAIDSGFHGRKVLLSGKPEWVVSEFGELVDVLREEVEK